MLLQIMCSPSEEFLIDQDDILIRERELQKHTRRYEERKGFSDSDDEPQDKLYSFGQSIFKKPDEAVVNKAKNMYFVVGSQFSVKNRNTSPIEQADMESVKLASLYLYASRLLQPIFDNDLVFITTLHDDAEQYPNMNSAERKICKLHRLLDFIKNEEKELKIYERDRRSTSANTRDSYQDSYTYQERLKYENIVSQEIDEIDRLKTFLLRCIIALNFIDEIGKDAPDFAKAFKELPRDAQMKLTDLKFKHLTQDVKADSVLRLFSKKLLEVKCQRIVELKQVKNLCEDLHKKCGVFIDGEFISTFIAEHQLQRMMETNDINDEVLSLSLRELKRFPFSFEIDKVVYMLIRLNKLQELLSLLSVRFLYIEQLELESNKATSNAYSHMKENEFFNQQKKICIDPILQVLENVFLALVERTKNETNPLKMLTSILESEKDKDVFDYLKDTQLKLMSEKQLNDLKAKLVKTVLLHDNERLHMAVLDWMTQNNLYDDLKTISSKYYSCYIEDFEKQNGLNIDQIELVWKYLQEQIKVQPDNKISTHNRLLSFLTPIIRNDSRGQNPKVKGELKINKRLNLIKIALLSIDELEVKLNSTTDLSGTRQKILNYEEILLLQSEIETNILKFLKLAEHAEARKEYTEKIKEINQSIYSPGELISKFTQPLKMPKYTIKAYYLIFKSSEMPSVKPSIKNEIVDCYKQIITHWATKVEKFYPKEC